MLKHIAILSPVLLLTACGPTMYVMQNPQTKEIAQCQADPAWRLDNKGPRDAKTCADAYVKAGWVQLAP